MARQKITILGATGSIGLSSLQVIEQHSDLFEVFALTAYTQKEKLLKLCFKHQPKFAVMANQTDSDWLKDQLGGYSKTQVLAGLSALRDVASDSEVDVVISAIVGAAGAIPTFAAAQAGKRILLANKETLVLAGKLFLQVVKKSGSLVLPVDSEHNAIFQVLPHKLEQVKNIVLTASGGPFLHTPLKQLEQVAVVEALSHPNWRMGTKISIDSATMMNKALEVIEASWLFNLPADKIKVVIHPESIIHSMVRLIDESVLAQLGVTDMKIPIEYCLAYPERIESGANELDFECMSELHFMKVDPKRFPALGLAYQVLEEGLDSGCILNAANEVAVGLFLENKIKFTDIYFLVVEVLNNLASEEYSDLETLLYKDNIVRQKTLELATRNFN
ncbi:MAG: 1-deoxy-D-xylulose-5-phosphate reductoisomerase [Neisseriaceae bacterium]|nr:MAG: 1-deoxy-D-xylulose-5-phosphate reductoisomerase [Neisseriaceae bacterium]